MRSRKQGEAHIRGPVRTFQHPPKPASKQVMLQQRGFQLENVSVGRQQQAWFCTTGFAACVRDFYRLEQFVTGAGGAGIWKPGFGCNPKP